MSEHSGQFALRDWSLVSCDSEMLPDGLVMPAAADTIIRRAGPVEVV